MGCRPYFLTVELVVDGDFVAARVVKAFRLDLIDAVSSFRLLAL